jgi:hypothetical protein
LSITQR